jgi:hypothetical protein
VFIFLLTTPTAKLPRLVHLVQSIPKDVPILLAPSSGRDALLNILHAKKVLDKNRIINWKSDTVYTADTVCMFKCAYFFKSETVYTADTVCMFKCAYFFLLTFETTRKSLTLVPAFSFSVLMYFQSLDILLLFNSVHKVYYAGEMGKGKGTKGQWDTLKQEWCSWALVMPRQRLQKLFVGTRTVHEDRQKNSTAVGTSSSGRKSPFDGV